MNTRSGSLQDSAQASTMCKATLRPWLPQDSTVLKL
jgi:hypothetical protein